jgi:hypothetical protein
MKQLTFDGISQQSCTGGLRALSANPILSLHWHYPKLPVGKDSLGRDEPVADDTVREGFCPTYSVDLPNSATQESSGIARGKLN